MEPDAFVDTNVLLRHVVQDHPHHGRRATALIVSIEQGQRAVRLADTVVFETVITLEKTYRVPRAEIRDAFQPILDLPGVILPGKRIYHEIFDLYVREPALSFADCSHLILTRQLRLGTIISFDQKLGRLPGVERIEP